ncbi:MAG: hypothetical protein WD336_02205 [Trueperaceae bacterium]
MSIRSLGVGFALLLFAGCSSLTDGEMVDLSEAQQHEIADLEDAAARDVYPPSEEGWTTIAPGVVRKRVEHEIGGVSVETRVRGLEALVWLAENDWLPRLTSIDARLASAGDLRDDERAQLKFERNELEVRLGAITRWEATEATNRQEAQSIQLASCNPIANASALPTSASSGAKGYATVRTCEADTAFGRASAWADNAGNWTHDYTYPATGQTGNSSAVKYGYPCGSSAWAEAYPLATSSDSFGC